MREAVILCFVINARKRLKNEGCTVRGVCGKTEDVADLQDLFIFTLKGIAYFAEKAKEMGVTGFTLLDWLDSQE